ncbi:uncharacterized protein LOC105838270 [Monomorium pharaonis]|uniref:uncharacterized protein LOC105838270 n=1 Tax=Monomorium pharaonis TaxID=307658 RepID=UPI00063F637C|nr:uncharacterized protein LOC105838270 [Monomorium pharaonis]
MKKAKKKTVKLRQLPVDDSDEIVDDYLKSPTDEDVGKDFGTLINAPLSKGGHFVLKSEKTWTVDSTQYSEFFTLNLKTLSAAIDCVPFNEYANVPDRYFVSDQLTSIYNYAERGKAAYSTILDDLNTLLDTRSGTNEDTRINQSENMELAINMKLENNIDDLEKDLDFLLSLKEPVLNTAIGISVPMSLSTSHVNTDSKTKSKNVPNKPIDLEKWLDSVLDD